MSAINAINSGMTRAMMVKPSPVPAAAAPPGAKPVTDKDGDSDASGSASDAGSNGRRVNLSA